MGIPHNHTSYGLRTPLFLPGFQLFTRAVLLLVRGGSPPMPPPPPFATPLIVRGGAIYSVIKLRHFTYYTYISPYQYVKYFGKAYSLSKHRYNRFWKGIFTALINIVVVPLKLFETLLCSCNKCFILQMTCDCLVKYLIL